MSDTQERQMKKSLADVAPNHKARYRWAIDNLLEYRAKTVIDAACGIGYGSLMMADMGFSVKAFDRSPKAAEFQASFFKHPAVEFMQADLSTMDVPQADAAVSIETIEHLEDDEGWLKRLREKCGLLIATVPNQDVVPFHKEGHPYHFRHYTKDEFTDLLQRCGWVPVEWATQYEKWDLNKSRMRPGWDGMTLGVVCQ